MKRAVPIAALFCFLPSALQAEILQEAVLAFPAQTTALEYDALSTLRALPNYCSLRKQYSGANLQRVREDLLLLDISEDQLSEVVTAAGPNGFFGLLAGTFHSAAAAKQALKQGMARSALDHGTVFCSKDGFCFLFPAGEEDHAFFATLAQLHAISDVRQGRSPSLRSNPVFMDLMSRMQPHSPVFGVAPGSEIGLWIGDSIPAAMSSRLDLLRVLSGIESFGYTVKLGIKAHVDLNVLCSSEQAGTVLKNALSALSGLDRASAMVAASGALPFTNMIASSGGRMVALSLDAPIH
jgi:hypothetical protein